MDDRSIKSLNYLQGKSIHREWQENYLNADLDPLYDAAYARLTERLGARDGDLILDAGCGYGFHAARLARRGLRVIGVDFSEAALAEARRNFTELGVADRVESSKADILDLPFRAGTFDHVNCWGVLMHIPDLNAALDELVRVLRVGGRMAICEVNVRSVHVRAVEPLLRAAKRALGRPIPMRKRSAVGIEEWHDDGKGGGLLVRKLDPHYLVSYLAERGVMLLDRFATALTEIYTSLPTHALKRVAHRINRLYFDLNGPPSLAQDNVFIFEKQIRQASLPHGIASDAA